MFRLNESLRGVHVLDLSRYLPGPLATLLLADLGAQVLKVEPPAGDEMRELGPRDATGRPVFYEAVNAGKSICRMDLKRAEVRNDFFELAKSADVVLESFRPGGAERLGIGYTELASINPRLIYCALSGYGANGPLAQAAGHDANYLALAGILDRNGDRSPMYFDPPVADTTGALFAVIAILAALKARERDGRGCEIDLGLADAVAPLQTFQIADYGARDYSPSRGETYLNGGAAYYRVYRTSDSRHVALGAVGEKFWNRFCEAAGHSEWTARAADPVPQHALIAEVQALFANLTLAECVERFTAVDCCFTPVLTLGEAMESEQCRARDLLRRAPNGALQALFPARVDRQAPYTRPPLWETGPSFPPADHSRLGP